MLALDASAAGLDWENSAARPSGELPPGAHRGRLHLVDAQVAQLPWQDKLQGIPAIRSALIPTDSEEGWSKPFSLIKADFEPWQSYYAGYLASRLFLQSSPGRAKAPVPDFPVRALFELKNADLRLLLEPLVQINGPVEYFDAGKAGETGHAPALAASLARASEATHRNQLKHARERGCAMGNALHEALLGEGMANLISAWEKRFQRKPTPHELHLMLTAGRAIPVQVAAQSNEPASKVPAPATLAPAPTQAGATERVPLPTPTTPSVSSVVAASPAVAAPAVAVAKFADQVVEKQGRARKGRAASRYLLHLAGALGVAAATYLFLWA